MDAKPKRRWYQFSLRTFFVLVTLVCVGFGWLGWQLRIVWDRRDFLQNHTVWYGPSNGDKLPRHEIPFYRLWLGDEEVKRLDVRCEGDVTVAAKLFPEATIIWVVQGPNFSLKQ